MTRSSSTAPPVTAVEANRGHRGQSVRGHRRLSRILVSLTAAAANILSSPIPGSLLLHRTSSTSAAVAAASGPLTTSSDRFRSGLRTRTAVVGRRHRRCWHWRRCPGRSATAACRRSSENQSRTKLMLSILDLNIEINRIIIEIGTRAVWSNRVQSSVSPKLCVRVWVECV